MKEVSPGVAHHAKLPGSSPLAESSLGLVFSSVDLLQEKSFCIGDMCMGSSVDDMMQGGIFYYSCVSLGSFIVDIRQRILHYRYAEDRILHYHYAEGKILHYCYAGGRIRHYRHAPQRIRHYQPPSGT